MYQKLASIVCISLIIMLTSCTDTNPNKYKLTDTWGADGTWKAAAKKKAKAKKKIVKVTSILDDGNTKTPEPIEKPKTEPKKEVSKAVVKKEANKNEPAIYLVSETKGWQKLHGSGVMNSYFVKGTDDSILNFSVSVVKTMGENDLKQKFKDGYMSKIAKNFAKFKLNSNKMVSINNKEAWEISYSFEKEGENFTQKQTFIPHSNNILLVNCTAPQDSFSKSQSDFSKIISSIKFN